MKKKVIIIGTAYPFRGGLSNFNERLARAITDAGYDTSIYTFSLQYPSFLFPGKTQFSSDPKPEDLDIKVAINSINPFNWVAQGRRIKEIAPDLVIIKFWIPFMAPCLGTLARIIRKNNKTKVITIIDNIIPHERRAFDKSLAGYFSRSVDGFLTMSESVTKQVELFDKTSPKVYSPHPIYDNFGMKLPKGEARELLSLDPNFKYILFFGFIRDYKGFDLLLKAMAMPEIRNMKLRVILAGEFYTDPEPYLSFITANQLQDHIVMHTDFIPDSKVSEYFSAADLVVQPYKQATQSGVTQVAYHFEVPMITTDVGGLAEIVPNGKVGYIVQPDANAIADGIVRFFSHPNPAQFIEHIRKEKKKYSWDVFVNKIVELGNLIKKQKSL